MLQSARAYRTTFSAPDPHPHLHPFYPISSLLKGHPKMNGVTSKEKIVWSYTPSQKTKLTSISAPPSPIASNVATKSPTTPRGTAPCRSTVGGASALTILMTTALPPIINASKTPASSPSGTQWSATTAQLPLKTTCMS